MTAMCALVSSNDTLKMVKNGRWYHKLIIHLKNNLGSELLQNNELEGG